MDAFRPFGSPGSLPDAPRKNLEKRRVELLEFTDVSTQFPQGISWPCFSPSLCCGHLPFNQVVCTARKRIVERTHPQPPDPQSETGTLATHSGKRFSTSQFKIKNIQKFKTWRAFELCENHLVSQTSIPPTPTQVIPSQPLEKGNTKDRRPKREVEQVGWHIILTWR